MFIERSAARIRSARTAFVAFCLLPCVVLVAWAAYWNSDSYRIAAVRRWGRDLGLEVDCDGIEHLRPGCVRLTNCRISTPDMQSAATIKIVEVEEAGNEMRVRVPRFDGNPAAVRAVGAAANSWLDEPSRHAKAWLVNIDSFEWQDHSSRGSRPGVGRVSETVAMGGVRIECVASGGQRGIRIRREPSSEEEIRVVRTLGDAGVERIIEARIDNPVPLECVGAMLAWKGCDSAGTCSGTLSARLADGVWQASGSGVIDGVDASVIPRAFGSPLSLEGACRIEVAKAAFDAGSISDATATVSIGTGAVSQDLLDRLVRSAKCRAGAAYHRETVESLVSSWRAFDEAAFRLRVDAAGLTIRALERRSGSLISASGRSLVDEPAEPISCESLLWVFADSAARPVPATASTAWLIPLLPKGGSERPR